MGAKTGIAWTSATWNPIRGCRRTAPEGSKQSGCENCYAERQAARFAGEGMPYEGLIKLGPGGPRWSGKTKFVRDHLLDPIRWTRPRRIFTDSMSDLFYEGIETWMIDQIVAVMMISSLHATKGGHVFQTLTKRPERMRDYFKDPETQQRVAKAAGSLMDDGDGWFDEIAFRPEGLVHPNMWWGTSIENRAAIDERLLPLLATPAACRFLSIEPMLDHVVIGLLGNVPKDIEPSYMNSAVHSKLHWVIVGCESGPGARPCDPKWIRAVRDECAETETAFFLKQAEALPEVIVEGDGSWSKGRGANGRPIIELPYLDGEQHAAFPDVPGIEFRDSAIGAETIDEEGSAA